MSLVAGLLSLDANGRIRNASGSAASSFNGGTPMVGEVPPLLSWENVAPSSFLGGLGYHTDQDVCASTAGGAIVAYAEGGFPVNAAGQLELSLVGVIDHYNAGIPCDTLGRPVIAAPEPPATIPAVEFHIDFTTGTAVPVIDSGTGSVVPAYVRPSEASVVQADGSLQWARTGELRLTRMVRVGNSVRSSDILGSGFTDNCSSSPAVTGGLPVGVNSAVRLTENVDVSQQHRRYEAVVPAQGSEGARYCSSLYISKASVRNLFGIVEASAGGGSCTFGWFRPSDGTWQGAISHVLNTSGGVRSVVDAGAWWRISMSCVFTNSPVNVFSPARLANAAGAGTYNGDGVSWLEFCGVQMEFGASSPSVYVSQGNLPAPYYHGCFVDGVKYTPDALGLNLDGALMEAPQTNRFLWTSQFADPVWSSSLAAMTVVPDAAVSPDLSVTADQIDVSAATAYKYQVQNQAADVVGKTFTFSVWLKAGTSNSIGIRIATGESGGSDSAFTTCALTASWQRFSVTRTFTGVSAVELQGGFDNRAGFGGTGVVGNFFAWGAQMEEFPIVSSYIRTQGSLVTRSADILYYTETAISSTPQLSLMVEFIPFETKLFTPQSGLVLGDAITNLMVAAFPRNADVSPTGRSQITVSSASVLDSVPIAGITPGVRNRMAITCKSGAQRAASNGVVSSPAGINASAPPPWDRMYVVGRPLTNQSPSICRKVFATYTWLTDPQMVTYSTVPP